MQDSGEKSIRLAKSSTSILRHRQAHEITTGRKFVSLTDFIEQFDWEYSDLDIVDRREIKHLDAENFCAISVNLRCRWKSLATFRR